MAAPSEKLAESLEVLKALQKEGVVAIRSADLSRVHRERLLKGGFLQEVMKGWYIPARPDEPAGESTAWYACFWEFCAAYLRERFGDAWSLSPEQSLLLHTGNRTVPGQLLVRTPKGGNKVTKLPHDTSVLDVRAAMPDPEETVEIDGLRLYALPAALVSSAPGFYRQHATEARAALAMVKDASDLLRPLLEGGHSTIAGRLAGALRNIGRDPMAEEIVKTMQASGYTIRVDDPFEAAAATLPALREVSPCVNRLRLMMPAFFELLAGEAEPSVRVVLGHFVFVYIHPYMDGNGRVGRFLMNLMLASGGYPWTVIPLEQRDAYMAALEEASVRQDIEPFAAFLAGLVETRLEGQDTAERPR